MCLRNPSFRHDTECIDQSAAAQARRRSSVAEQREAQKNRDYRAKKSLALKIKTGKKKKTQSEADNIKHSVTISTLLSNTGSSGAGPSRAGRSHVHAARDVQRQLQLHRERQEQRERLEWQNEDPAYRLKEAEENNDRHQLRQIEIDLARSARREADREFFRIPIS